MAAMRGPRLQVGSAAWVSEERSSALHIAQTEVEEFSYSARNELDWLNEHMAGIFDENETNFAEVFKTPAKIRGKTPRTARKAAAPPETRVPLSDVFSSTPHNVAAQPQTISSVRSPPSQALGSPSPKRTLFSPLPRTQLLPQDSGYHGSQETQAVRVYSDPAIDDDERLPSDAHSSQDLVPSLPHSPIRDASQDLPDAVGHTPQADLVELAKTPATTTRIDVLSHQAQAVAAEDEDDVMSDAPPSPPPVSSPSPEKLQESKTVQLSSDIGQQKAGTGNDSDVNSNSDGSSPIRPIVRKSSLNFASLPAREPLTAGKSMGGRRSRTSHLENIRTSYYGRPNHAKSLGKKTWNDSDSDGDDGMDAEDENKPVPPPKDIDVASNYNKTHTQRLQDQISLLGRTQSDGSRCTKSIPPNHNMVTKDQIAGIVPASPVLPPKVSTTKRDTTQTTPGAFPEDDYDEEDDDDWIQPPSAIAAAAESRPALPKSHTTDVMEHIPSTDKIGAQTFHSSNDLDATSTRAVHQNETDAPKFGHGKSASVITLPTLAQAPALEGVPFARAATITHPSMTTVDEDGISPSPRSPARNARDSPLKQVKNKLSSILKSSKNLLASSAAISAEGKSFIMSPSTTRLTHQGGPSTDSVNTLASHAASRTLPAPAYSSPSKPVARRTRASAEREKEQKRLEKEEKRAAEQMDKLEKAREQERDKARAFSKEQARIASHEADKLSLKPAERPTLTTETPKPTRTSPRKAKAPDSTATRLRAEDSEMLDAPTTTAPPSSSRPLVSAASIPRKELKRPMKPGKDVQFKPKQAPTVIRVNMGSQYHPPPSVNTSNVVENQSAAVAQSGRQTPSASAARPNLQSKASSQSLRGNQPSISRPKPTDALARKKEQEEREAQRRRDAKAEMERKRVAAQEEQRRQEQQRKQEMDKSQATERSQNAAAAASATDAKPNAQRQAAIERAKQTRAPPPAPRSQPNGPPDFALPTEKPASVPAGAAKGAVKRTLPAADNDAGQGSRPPSRAGVSYQAKDAKRRRTSENHRDELEDHQPPNIKGPPVRPSQGFKKELPAKPVYQTSHANAPPSATRDLFKATVTAQHNSQSKVAHPLDMSQISKGPIPFAPASSAHKTPARPGQMVGPKSTAKKSASRSSPRFQNGESIELPEIDTDDEDEYDEPQGGMAIAAWADSPDLRRALMRQETMDPSQIFGPPAPLNMEEVFSKSKDRWHKFRARTSSANWTGADRLTEDEIRKDMVARDKMRRDGGWSYEMSRGMI